MAWDLQKQLSISYMAQENGGISLSVTSLNLFELQFFFWKMQAIIPTVENWNYITQWKHLM